MLRAATLTQSARVGETNEPRRQQIHSTLKHHVGEYERVGIPKIIMLVALPFLRPGELAIIIFAAE